MRYLAESRRFPTKTATLPGVPPRKTHGDEDELEALYLSFFGSYSIVMGLSGIWWTLSQMARCTSLVG